MANGERDNITHLTEVLVLRKLDLIDALQKCAWAHLLYMYENDLQLCAHVTCMLTEHIKPILGI